MSCNSLRIGFRIVVAPKKLDRRCNQKSRQPQFVQQLVDTRKYMGVRNMRAILRQQVLYTRQGSRGWASP